MDFLKGFSKFVIAVFAIGSAAVFSFFLLIAEFGRNIHLEGGVHEDLSRFRLMLPAGILALCGWATYKLLTAKQQQKPRPGGDSVGEFDRRIIAKLRVNGPMTSADISSSVGIDSDVVAEATRRLLQTQKIKQTVQDGVALYEITGFALGPQKDETTT